MDNNTAKGSALPLSLSGSISSGDLSAEVNGDVSGWPNGANHRTFVAFIDKGTDHEERVLCSSLNGSSPATVTIDQRGYDGTVAQGHDANATFVHTGWAGFIDEGVLHVLDPDRDDHSQYLTIGRHQDASLHTFGDGEALGQPSSPAPIASSASGAQVGNGQNPAVENHVHIIGPGAIDDPAMLGPNVIVTAAIVAGAVINADIGANSVSPNELQIGTALTAVGNHDATQAADATHIALPPDPTLVTFWLQPDKQRLYAYENAAWRLLAGSPIKCVLAYSVDGNNIANGFTPHDLLQFTATANEFGMASGGGILTIPANVAGPPAYQFDGEWEFHWEILVSDAIGTAPLELGLVTNTLSYVLNIEPSNPSGHSTLLKGSKVIPLLAGATAKLQLAQGAAGNVFVKAGSTFEARYRGPA